jgi:hypothetical protein
VANTLSCRRYSTDNRCADVVHTDSLQAQPNLVQVERFHLTRLAQRIQQRIQAVCKAKEKAQRSTSRARSSCRMPASALHRALVGARAAIGWKRRAARHVPSSPTGVVRSNRVHPGVSLRQRLRAQASVRKGTSARSGRHPAHVRQSSAGSHSDDWELPVEISAATKALSSHDAALVAAPSTVEPAAVAAGELPEEQRLMAVAKRFLALAPAAQQAGRSVRGSNRCRSIELGDDTSRQRGAWLSITAPCLATCMRSIDQRIDTANRPMHRGISCHQLSCSGSSASGPKLLGVR